MRALPIRFLAGPLPPAISLPSCAESKGSAKLAGAVHPTIPVFEPSNLVSSEAYGFAAGADFSSLDDYDAIAWRLSSVASVNLVTSFYERLAPREDDEDDASDGASDGASDREVEHGGDSGDEFEDEDPYLGPGETFRIYPEGEDGDIEITITVLKKQHGGRTLFMINETVPDGRR